MHHHRMKIFSGNSNPVLAQDICDYLGEPLSEAKISRFSDGETMFRVNENIRGCDVFVVQSGPEFKLLATNPLGEVCMATPAITKGMLLFRTRSHLYAVGEQ